jgi:hypothetical protein
MMEKENFQPHSRSLRLLFFWVGIFATLAYRTIVVANNLNPTLVQIFWYSGTIGFFVYFLHRFDVSSKRARLIERYRLSERIRESSDLSADEKDAMGYVFSTLRSSKEKWNYVVIFVSSALALLLGFYLDFLR